MAGFGFEKNTDPASRADYILFYINASINQYISKRT